jgi:hypothetical protein
MKRSSVAPPTSDHYSLWLLTLAPTIWAAHLLLCYVTAAIWCAKVAPVGGSLGSVQPAIIWYTAVSLIAIALIGREGFRRHSAGASRHAPAKWDTETTTHDLDTVTDRHRFVGFATLLLAGLSAVGVVYAALAANYFETCR